MRRIRREGFYCCGVDANNPDDPTPERLAVSVLEAPSLEREPFIDRTESLYGPLYIGVMKILFQLHGGSLGKVNGNDDHWLFVLLKLRD